MLDPSEYQARCEHCGFHSREFRQGHSSGIGQKTGPKGPYNPFNERSSHLRIVNENVICIHCGTLYERQFAGIDHPLSPVLLIIAACFLVVALIVRVRADPVTLIIASAIACFIAIISIRTFRSAFSRRLRSYYSDWIAEIEPHANICPQCGCGDAVRPFHKSPPLPCPQCGEKAMSIICTYKGTP